MHTPRSIQKGCRRYSHRSVRRCSKKIMFSTVHAFKHGSTKRWNAARVAASVCLPPTGYIARILSILSMKGKARILHAYSEIAMNSVGCSEELHLHLKTSGPAILPEPCRIAMFCSNSYLRNLIYKAAKFCANHLDPSYAVAMFGRKKIATLSIPCTGASNRSDCFHTYSRSAKRTASHLSLRSNSTTARN